MQGRLEDDDWMMAAGERLPVSPLSALGFVLAAVIGLRIAAENLTTRALLESIFPFLAATAVVVSDRWLVSRGVTVRDRITVFSYGLGGFLAAALVTGLHLHVMWLYDGVGYDPLYMTLMSGTIGVAAGTVAGLYAIRQREAAREARRQRERLEEFASVVSHDLRNPLGVAQGRLREAFRTGDAEHLKRVDGALERMDELIEETLSVARNGTVVTDPEAVSLCDLVAEAWETVEPDSATYELIGDRTIRVDRTRAKKLFENLFRNAREHGGTGVHVRVGTCPNGFYVEDDGPGIPDGERDAVLDQGYSTAEDGSGLGLAIVQAIAEAHGWTVVVGESESGGARFEFRGA